MNKELLSCVLDYNVVPHRMGLANGNVNKPKIVYVGSVYNCITGKVVYRAISSMVEQKVIEDCEQYIKENNDI